MMQDNFFQKLDSMFQTQDIKAVEEFIITAMERVQKEKDLPSLLAITNELGGVFRVTNRLDEAKKVYEIALEVIRLLKLENSPQHGTTLLNLGSVCTEAKDAEEALKYYNKAAEIFKASGLQKDYRVAALYNNMSHAYDMLSESYKAMELAEKALVIMKKLSGYDIELATTYTTLASRYIKMQQYEKAHSYLTQAEKLFLKLPGKQNVHYAATLNSMGDLLYRQGKFGEAENCFEKALDLVKENYGDDSNSYAEILKNLSKVRKAIQTGQKGSTGSMAMRMTGMGLAESYFDEYGRRMIREEFPEYQKYMAVGLVGEGSECFGFDDELSESHDFGPGFCIWLPDDIYEKIGPELKRAYAGLPRTYRNKSREETSEGFGRVGVFSIDRFYKKYIGCTGIPKNNVEWLFAPETSLSTATNGNVFEDNYGEFSRIRNGLLNFYPRDVYLKKLAARMAMMSQSGQYNYERCMKRGETAAAYLSCSEFVKATVSAVYLVNKKYMPFYKWMFRGFENLTKLQNVKPLLEQLIKTPDMPDFTREKVELIEKISIMIRDELGRQGIIEGSDPFLNSHCRHVMSLISDPQMKSLPVMFDGN